MKQCYKLTATTKKTSLTYHVDLVFAAVATVASVAGTAAIAYCTVPTVAAVATGQPAAVVQSTAAVLHHSLASAVGTDRS